MAVNLIDSTDIEITQTGNNIQLSTTVDMQTLESNVSTNASNIENLQTYSTNEVNTGKVWIDGKPIYRKVFTGTKLASSNLTIGTMSDLDTIINMTGSYIDTYGNKKPIPYYYSINNELRFWVTPEVQTTGDIVISGANSPYASGQVELIVEYTKITN